MAALELNQFSRRIADALFKRFPDWRQYARVEENEHRDEGGILYLEVPVPPGSNLNRPLYVLTANDEVVVGFDSDHNHFEDLVENGVAIAPFKRFWTLSLTFLKREWLLYPGGLGRHGVVQL